MPDVPADIFTEPDLSPDGLANLGPLRPLAGLWQGDGGTDVSPKAPGPQTKRFTERLRMEVIDPQTNGPQLFYGLRYHIHINDPDEAITFHDQVGYWLWEPESGMILQSVTIPRGQALLAIGRAARDDRNFSVMAMRGETTSGIVSNPFLDEAFRTDHYSCAVTIHDDDSWSYEIHTHLKVKGQPGLFDHHDINTLRRIGPAVENPLEQIVRQGAAKG